MANWAVKQKPTREMKRVCANRVNVTVEYLDVITWKHDLVSTVLIVVAGKIGSVVIFILNLVFNL